MTETAQGSVEDFSRLMAEVLTNARARLERTDAGLAAGSGAISRLDAVPSEVVDIFNEYARDPSVDGVNSNASNVAPAAQQCAQGDMSLEDFKELLDHQQRNNADWLDNTIDGLGHRLKEAGNAHPEWQQIIISGFSQAAHFLTGVWNQVNSYLNGLVDDVGQAWQKVDDFFANVRQTIVSWFASTFG